MDRRWAAVAIVVLSLLVSAGLAFRQFAPGASDPRNERLAATVAAVEAAAGRDAAPVAPSPAPPTPSPASTAAAHEVSVELLLVGIENTTSDGFARGAACQGRGGVADLRAGAPIRVLGERGEIIASAPLGNGESSGSVPWATDEITCLFTATVSVPEADSYEFQVAGRGGPLYSRADLEAAGWKVELSMGG